MKLVALFLATAGGAGLAPIAPGTVGSAVGVLAYLLTRGWPVSWQFGLVVAVSLVGVWAGGVAERHYGREDPGAVVIDEVAGQLATLFLTGVGVGGAVLAFFLFRVLDIIKPWPARQFEALHGGTGIMADDLMAGVYGNLLMRAALLVLPSLAG
jgi:phosphatidylglycerophosphatase A